MKVIDYTTVQIPKTLRDAIAILRKTSNYKTNANYLAAAVRDYAWKSSYQLSDDELDKVIALLEETDKALAEQSKINKQHLKKISYQSWRNRRKDWKQYEKKRLY